MLDSVRNSVDASTPFKQMFFLLFGETLASFLGLLVTCFFIFHVWLMSKAMTTIEYCEKASKGTRYNDSPYEGSALGNVKSVLGDNWLLWMLPVSPPSGTGLVFMSEDTRLTADMEAGRALRRRSHPEASGMKRRNVRNPRPGAGARPGSSGGTGSAPGSGAPSSGSESPEVSDAGAVAVRFDERPVPSSPGLPVSSGTSYDKYSTFEGQGSAARVLEQAVVGVAPTTPRQSSELPPSEQAAAVAASAPEAAPRVEQAPHAEHTDP
jgi:hypothetical protein